MKDLFLIPIILAVFAFGYYIMARVDRFIAENQRLVADENRKGKCKVRIAAESPILLERVASVLEQCAGADPHLDFFLSSGRSDRLLEKLLEEQIDIVLLHDTQEERLESQYTFLRIRGERIKAPVNVLGLPVADLEEDSSIRVVWKRALSSKDRDRVIFALENEACGISCGGGEEMKG